MSTMASPSVWSTAMDLAARYVVGEQELYDHSYQGTLALRRSPDGPDRFDEGEVARLFPLRGKGSAGLGLLGDACLGEPPPEPVARVTEAPYTPPPNATHARPSSRLHWIGDWSRGETR
jgi:hypothetical protein